METFSAEVADSGKFGVTVAISGHIDSKNAGAFEKSVRELRTQNPQGSFTLDVADLEYISSAGLRAVMKLLRENPSLTIKNASPDVYGVFEMTGFTEFLPVKRAAREMSIDGLELIGQGVTAKVYRIDPETAVKVFDARIPIEAIERETVRCRDAFIAGIPTAIPFDTVKVGDCYGSVFELLDAKNLTSVLAADKEHLAENTIKFAQEIQSLHQIEVDPSKFPDSLTRSYALCDRLVGVICDQAEADKIRAVHENIPQRHTFLHGDCHPGNIMYRDGEYLFIDLASGGMGHPILDMVSMYLSYVLSVPSGRYKTSPHTRDFTAEECGLIWHSFLAGYLNTDDEALIKKAEHQIAIVSSARFVFTAISMPGLFPRESLRHMVEFVSREVDAGLEPICF